MNARRVTRRRDALASKRRGGGLRAAVTAEAAVTTRVTRSTPRRAPRRRAEPGHRGVTQPGSDRNRNRNADVDQAEPSSRFRFRSDPGLAIARISVTSARRSGTGSRRISAMSFIAGEFNKASRLRRARQSVRSSCSLNVAAARAQSSRSAASTCLRFAARPANRSTTLD